MSLSIFWSKFKQVLTHYDIWWIALLALFIRVIGMRWMSYTSFPEFYRDYGMASRILSGHMVALGPPSMLGGFHFPSFYYYLLVPFLWLFHSHPLGLIFTGIVFSVFSVVALFKLLLLWTDSRGVARTGGFLSALSVYSLHLTSYVSNPNFLPLFVLWYMYHLTKVVRGQASTSHFVWLGVAFALATQLHVTALIVLPIVTILAMAILRARINVAGWWRAIIVIVFLYLPYIIYEVAHSFANTLRLFHLGGQNLHGGNVWVSVLAIWNFFLGTLTPFSYAYSYSILEPNSLYWVVALAVGMVLLIFLFKYFSGGTRHESGRQKFVTREAWVILLLWVFVEVLTILLYSRAVHDHYLIILWPTPIIFLSFGVWWLKRKFGLFMPVVCALAVVFSLQIYSFYHAANTSWSEFQPVYEQNYKNNLGLEEIGSRW